MLLPFDTTPLVELCEQLDSWRGKLDRKGPLPRLWSGHLRRSLEAEAVAASLGIEQIPVTIDDVRRILAGAAAPYVSDADRALVEGYRDAMGLALRRADDPSFSWNSELIRGVHDRVLGGSFAAGAGRFTDRDRWLGDHATGKRIYTPPGFAEVPGLVDEACARANDMAEHPAIVAAWVHVATAAIHPFRDGNGRTSRVLASLAMLRGDFRRREFTSLEEWWGRHVASYYAAFGCLGDTFDRATDVTPFLQVHVSAQLSQVHSLDLRERVQRRIWTAIENILYDRRMPQRLAYAVWEVLWERDVTSGYYVGMTDVSTASATKDLASAVAVGLLDSRGERRARRYLAGTALVELLGEELGIPNLPPDLSAVRGIIGEVLGQAIVDDTSS